MIIDGEELVIGNVIINRGKFKDVTARVEQFRGNRYRLELPISCIPVEEQAPNIRDYFLWTDRTGFDPVPDYQI